MAALGGPLCGAAMGVAYFFAMVPAKILDPRYVEWLFAEDAAAHYLGWRFFRDEPWAWPPGATYRYGEAMSSSIVYSDSIPLLAIVLKPFSAMLPIEFQYSGWWLLACFALTGGFAWCVGVRATRTQIGGALTAGFAVMSPIILDRATGHFALAAHWIVLWSLLNYVRLPQSILASGSPVWVASLVHAYLLLMVLAVWCAEQVRFLFEHVLRTRRVSLQRFAARGAGVALVLAALLWATGYFTLSGGSVGGTMYGLFALNLNGFVNPIWGSVFLPGLPVRFEARFEGFAYLGAGLLVLAPIAAVMALASSRRRAEVTRVAPLLVAALVLVVLALSHEIYLGDRMVLRIPWPDGVLTRLGTFRASGRFAWVLYYCVMVGSVAAVLRHGRRKVAVAIVSCALVLQGIDLLPRFAGLREHFRAHFGRAEGIEATELAAPEWQEIARRYQRIHVVPMEFKAPNYFRLGLFAARHDMSINVGYFSRVSHRLGRDQEALLERVRRGAWEEGTVYVLNAEQLLSDIPLGPDDAVLHCDGMLIVAPGWRR